MLIDKCWKKEAKKNFFASGYFLVIDPSSQMLIKIVFFKIFLTFGYWDRWTKKINEKQKDRQKGGRLETATFSKFHARRIKLANSKSA